jgi:hypothetical protein
VRLKLVFFVKRNSDNKDCMNWKFPIFVRVGVVVVVEEEEAKLEAHHSLLPFLAVVVVFVVAVVLLLFLLLLLSVYLVANFLLVVIFASLLFVSFSPNYYSMFSLHVPRSSCLFL